ncbi:transporter substrate-binding domain-containing protein [Xylanimonas allomyrinae]|uniref:Transporter substrate-binding domain-containing protein n=1 Tax=Xylanimonas allomyrinae TaxID=2509459 RepID=A0A4P6EN28_9MICO|nr:transporter substrate-binding domain-containing protein [Xylanimonas allomyrinae]QAY63103.1 transporter substrate-binding domain-containing protein [Xylanimonas allomyrinae]
MSPSARARLTATALMLVTVATVSTVASGCAGGDAAHGAGPTSAAPSGSLEEIKASGVLTVGVFRDLAPFGSVGADGAYAGYDIYLGDQLGKDLGVRVDYVGLDAQGRVPALTSGKVDLVLANFAVTPERQQQVDFSLPYMQAYQALVSPDDAPVTDVSQLAGKKLIVTRGTSQQAWFTEHFPDVEQAVFQTQTDAYAALKDGRGAALAQSNLDELAWTRQNPGFTVGVERIGDPTLVAAAVAKGDQSLLDWVNQEITTGLPDHFFHDDYATTLAQVYGPDADPDDIVVERGKAGA